MCALRVFFLPAHLEALCATQAAFTGHEFLTNFDEWITCTFLYENVERASAWGGLAFATFEGEQCPLQRAECRGVVSGADLLKEAIRVMAPKRTCKAVDPRCQLPTNT